MLVASSIRVRASESSRFAKEQTIYLQNIRVFKSTRPHLLLPEHRKMAQSVRVFETKCDSVKEYIRLLNEHPHMKILEK